MPSFAPKLRLVNALDASDEALLLEVAQGRREAFQTLVQRHAQSLTSFCARQIGDASVAEDLAQDVFAAVWNARERFGGGDAAAWLFTFAVNRCRKHQRSWRRWLKVAGKISTTPVNRAPSALEALEQYTRGKALSSAIDRLPLLQKEAVVLRFEAQLDYRTIGQVVGCTEGAARARTFDAIRNLRAQFDEES